MDFPTIIHKNKTTANKIKGWDEIATKISSSITAREKRLIFRLNQWSFNEQSSGVPGER